MKFFHKIIGLVCLGTSFLYPKIIMAVAPPSNLPSSNSNTGVDAPGSGITLNNPLKSTDLVSFLNDILSAVMIFAVPLIVFMIIYAGFTYVMAQGNESQVGKAHKALLYAVIGGVLILGAQALLTVIQGTVDALK